MYIKSIKYIYYTYKPSLLKKIGQRIKKIYKKPTKNHLTISKTSSIKEIAHILFFFLMCAIKTLYSLHHSRFVLVPLLDWLSQ